MGRQRIGMQETDGNRFDLLRDQLVGDSADSRFVERQQNCAVGRDSFGHRVAQRPRHQFRRPLDVDIELFEAFLKAHFENVAKPFGGQERGARTFALDQRVGRQGRAVNEQIDLGRANARFAEQPSYAFNNAEFGLPCGGQHFARITAIRRFQHHVSEGAADIGGQLGFCVHG